MYIALVSVNILAACSSLTFQPTLLPFLLPLSLPPSPSLSLPPSSINSPEKRSEGSRSVVTQKSPVHSQSPSPTPSSPSAQGGWEGGWVGGREGGKREGEEGSGENGGKNGRWVGKMAGGRKGGRNGGRGKWEEERCMAWVGGKDWMFGWVSWWVGGRESRVEVMSQSLLLSNALCLATFILFQVADVLVRPLSRLCL